jgi:hypothetical protein
MGGTPTTPFEFKLADGSVVKAENIEEAFKTVAKMKEDTSAALRTEREQREGLQQQMEALRAEVAQRTAPPRVSNGGFDRDHYYKLVGDDPMMAQNYLDAHRFGIQDPTQVPQYFQGLQSTVSNLEQQTLAATFINTHPDFPANNDNAKILTQEVIRLREAGHPIGMDTLDLAWRNCQSAETIKPVEPPDERDEPNPSMGGGGSSSMDAEASRIEADVISGKMSMGDFEKYLQSKGMLR